MRPNAITWLFSTSKGGTLWIWKNALLSASGWNPKLHNYHPPLFKVLFLHPQCEVSGYPSRRSRNMDDDIRSVIIIVYVRGPSEWSSPATASVQGLHQAQLCRPHAAPRDPWSWYKCITRSCMGAAQLSEKLRSCSDYLIEIWFKQ